MQEGNRMVSLSEIRFEKLSKEERGLLLSAFDYKVDHNGFILTPTGAKIHSEEFPKEFMKSDSAAMVPGSLKIIDGTPTAISKFMREKGCEDERH